MAKPGKILVKERKKNSEVKREGGRKEGRTGEKSIGLYLNV